MTNFSDMLSKAKAMQEKMKEAQDQIKKIEVEGEAGGNLVKVILTGDYELKSIIISDATNIFADSGFSIFANNIKKGAIVRAIPAPKAASRPRKSFTQV